MKRQKLINARLSRGLEQADVADAIGVTPKTVSRWENGIVTPYRVHVKALCAYFEMSKEELELDVVVPTGELETPDEPLPESLPALLHRHVMTKPSSRWYYERKQTHVEALVHLTYMRNARKQRKRSRLPERSHPVAPGNETAPRLGLIMNEARRQALYQLLNGACVIVTLSPYALLPQESRERLALAQIHPSYLDNDALDDLSRMTTRYWRMLGNAPLDTLLGVASHHFEIIMQFLKDPRPTRIYNRLCTLASENAQLLGRIFHLFKEYGLAYDYYTFALKVALDVGHTDLWAAGVGRIAMLHLRQGNPSKGLSLLQEAQRVTLHDPRFNGWLSSVEAYIYAELPDENAYLRSMERVKSITMPASLDGDIYHTSFDSCLAAGFEGRCLISLRQPEKALPVLGQAITLAGPTRIHGYIEGTTDRAKAYAQLGDPKQACQLLGQVLDTITQIKSLSHLQRVHEARAELQRWGHSADVKALDERLRHTVKALKQRTEDS